MYSSCRRRENSFWLLCRLAVEAKARCVVDSRWRVSRGFTRLNIWTGVQMFGWWEVYPGRLPGTSTLPRLKRKWQVRGTTTLPRLVWRETLPSRQHSPLPLRSDDTQLGNPGPALTASHPLPWSYHWHVDFYQGLSHACVKCKLSFRVYHWNIKRHVRCRRKTSLWESLQN